ncbi:hypothetical protein H6F96_21565 [Microcoleus sp. FACHB-53]|nr:hypothetical protein [Microcoleus sp. FACHB-53]
MMKLRFLLLAIAALLASLGTANWAVALPVRSQTHSTPLSQYQLRLYQLRYAKIF